MPFCRHYYREITTMLCAVAAAGVVFVTGTPIGADGPLLDVLVKARSLAFAEQEGPTTSPVAVIAVDARSLNEKELAKYPRTLFAKVWAQTLGAVGEAGAQAIGFDFLFAYSGNRLAPDLQPDFDRPFLQALGRYRDRVVLGRSATTVPARPFQGALRLNPEALGVVDLPSEADGAYRRIPAHFPDDQGNPVPGLASALLRRAKAPSMPEELVIAPRYHLERIPTYAIVDVLRCATQAPEVLQQAFRDKIVLVGGTLPEEDRKRSAGKYLAPKSTDGPLLNACGLRRLGASAPESRTVPGVYLHAAAIDAVVTGNLTTIVPTSAIAGLAMATAVGTAAVSLLCAPWLAGATSLGIVVLVFGIATGFLEGNAWVPITLPLLAVVATFIIAYVVRYLVETRRKQAMQQELMFLGGLPSSMVEQMASGGTPLQLGGAQADITVMFADLSGFTKLSTQVSPDVLAAKTTQYLALIVQQVEATGGWVNKFIGDCVMAIWGAPVPDPHHAVQAIHAARAAVAHINRMREEAEGKGEVGFKIKIGLNSGSAFVGRMGTLKRGTYTAMGETVNLAARLEGIPGIYNCSVVIGPQTAEQVKHTFFLRELDTIKVKGKDQPITVYEPLEEHPAQPDRKELVERYMKALADYRAGRFTEAADAWDALACTNLETGHKSNDKATLTNPSATMAERAKAFSIKPPPPSWDGVWVLTTK